MPPHCQLGAGEQDRASGQGAPPAEEPKPLAVQTGINAEGQPRVPVQTGISIVDLAASLLDQEVNARIDCVDTTELAPYDPGQTDRRPVHCAQQDCVPWSEVKGLIRSVPRAGRCSGDASECSRSLTPEEHIRQHWNAAASVPLEMHPLDQPPEIPEGILSALKWMHECSDFEGWAVAQVRLWQRISRQLEPARLKWREGLAPDVAAVLPPQYHGPLHREMLVASGHQDVHLSDDIARGFPMSGILPDSLQFESVMLGAQPAAQDLERALERAVERRDDTLRALLSKPRREPGTEEVRRQTLEEAHAGKMAGPWRVYLNSDGDLVSEVPFKRWLPTHRFPRIQQRVGSSFAVRPIDDCTASGLNPAAAVVERMRMSGLPVLLAICDIIARDFADWQDDGAPVLAKGDHKQAYRQWAVRPEHQCYVVSLVWSEDVGPQGGFLAFAHRALPFGALAAVWGYGRTAGSVCHLLRRLFSVPQLAWVDDFMRAAPKRFAALLQWIFKEVHAMLGIPLKGEKNQGPSARLELLGMEIAATSLWSGLRLTCKRKEDLRVAVNTALRTKHLSAREAQRLGGQLGFASSAFFGRVGRGFAPVVSHHKGGWTPQLEHALEWWHALLQVPLNFYQEHGRARTRAMTWVDGSWERETATGAVGAVLFVQGKGQWSLSAQIPRGLRQELLRLDKEQRNTQSELLAVLMLLLSKPEELRGSLLEIWEDNTAALYNILSGSAGDEHSRELVAAIWLLAAALRVHIWIGYVPSEANCADPFSRPDESEKQREAAALANTFKLRSAVPVLPASICTKPEVWAAAVAAAGKPSVCSDRAEQAKVAAHLGVGAVDGATLWQLLSRVAFGATDTEVVLGWLTLRRKGLVGAATGFHSDLTRVLCASFKQQCPNTRCTSIILTRGRRATPPSGAGPCVAVAQVSCESCTWTVPGSQWAAPPPSNAVRASFFAVSGKFQPSSRHEAVLAKHGFPL